MTVAPSRHVVVVDGSNLATEGRTTPSLRQLDEAVRAYAGEDPGAEIVVVVDASFEHRIDPSERHEFHEAELHGEIVSPPAGAIGRGDAFVLRIAERTGARVLSNDSFQEFHAEHPWLFDRGRLVGGKPVPGVGWIFTPRIPVRGPKSRAANGKSKGEDAQALSHPVKAAELAKAAKKVAARKAPVLPDGSTPKVGDTWPPPTAAAGADEAKKKAKKGEAKVASDKHAKSKRATEKVEKGGGGGPAEAPTKGTRAAAAKGAAAKKAAAKKGPAAPATKKTLAEDRASAKLAATRTSSTKDAGAGKIAPAKAGQKRSAAREGAGKKAEIVPEPAKLVATKAPRKDGVVKKAAQKKAAANEAAAPKKESRKRVAATGTKAPPKNAVLSVVSDGAVTAKSARSTAAKDPVVQEAIGHALAEAIAPAGEPRADGRNRGDQKRGKQDGKGAGHRRRRASAPPPAVNEPLAFITFVATYPLDSELEGQVVSFTSHGAMVDVDLPGGGVLHSYIPLSAMGDPPPTKARQVLTRGERRPFVLTALDPPRRVAELALPEVVEAPGAPRR